VVAAPSGAGKSTVTRALLAADPQLMLSVSLTTRQPRPGEIEGVHYFFTDVAGFKAQVETGGLLEWAEVFGRFYGTPRAAVEQALAAGRDVVFDIDWQGWRQIRAALPADAVGVFILPPSLQALRARLTARAGDSEAEISRRMAQARAEIGHWREFDHVVVNDALDACIAAVGAVIMASRSATARRADLEGFVAALMHETP